MGSTLHGSVLPSFLPSTCQRAQHWRGFAGDLIKSDRSRSIEVYRVLGHWRALRRTSLRPTGDHPTGPSINEPKCLSCIDLGGDFLPSTWTWSPRDRLKDADPWQKLGSQFPIRDSNVVLGLQVQPEPGLHAEEQPEPKRCIHGDGALAIHQFADPAGRDVDVRRELASTDAHGLHEILQQDLTRMNLFEQLGHAPHS